MRGGKGLNLKFKARETVTELAEETTGLKIEDFYSAGRQERGNRRGSDRGSDGEHGECVFRASPEMRKKNEVFFTLRTTERADVAAKPALGSSGPDAFVRWAIARAIR